MRALRKAVPLTAVMIALMIWAVLPDSEKPPQADSTALIEAEVTQVWDGDTLHAEVQGEDVKIRLIGMDCPEIGEKAKPFGNEARKRAAALAEGQDIWLEADAGDTDKYGRSLRYVWLSPPADASSLEEASKKMLNAILLKEGLAEVMTIPPNTRWAERFEDLEDDARRNRMGMWEQ